MYDILNVKPALQGPPATARPYTHRESHNRCERVAYWFYPAPPTHRAPAFFLMLRQRVAELNPSRTDGSHSRLSPTLKQDE
jgi:hypothetical protein